jgi:hypothetical protein
MRAVLPDPGWPPGATARGRPARRIWPTTFSILTGPDALLIAAFLLLGVRLLTVLPSSFSVDSWLELATGRLIWQTGIPHHETLTTIAYGRAWVDQQWLAQLTSYGLYRLGGLALVGVVNVILLMSGLGGALIAARKLGASLRDVLVPAVLCGWLFVPASEVRTQAFAIPLFALTTYLLALDSRHASRRVLWTLPILVLWGNVHGTASIGAGLVLLRGLTLMWERRRLRNRPRYLARPLALVLGAPLALLLTPYGLHSIAYYQSTLGNSALRHLVTEWQPVTSSPLIAAPFFLLAGVTVWSFGRSAERTTLWEKLALVALAVASVDVIRNVVFFALAALVILPQSLDGLFGNAATRPVATRRRLNGALVGGAAAIAAVSLAVIFGRPAATLEGRYHKPAMLAAIERAMGGDPALKLVDDTRYADWMLWQAPWLAGRVADDSRFELYRSSQLYAFQRLDAAIGLDWKRAADGYRLLVLDRSADADAIKGFRAEPGAKLLYSDGQAVVILRSSAHGK